MSAKKRFYAGLGVSFWVLTAIFVLLPSWPHIYYRLSPQASSLLASTIASTAAAASETVKSPSPTPLAPKPTPTPPKMALPEVDPTLPAENGLIIDKIGVRGQIHEGEDWQTILKQGSWRVPSFDTPPVNDRPIILAAHRWGYLEWSASFRKLNSFYNLPQLKAGDTVVSRTPETGLRFSGGPYRGETDENALASIVKPEGGKFHWETFPQLSDAHFIGEVFTPVEAGTVPEAELEMNVEGTSTLFFQVVPPFDGWTTVYE